MDSADRHNHIFSVPRLRAFDWPPRGSLEYMRNWTLEKENNSIVLLSAHGQHAKRRKDTHPPSKCFTCGLPWLDPRQLSPAGESSHWFVDIHDGVSRKVAYLFCWRCVEGVQRRLRPAHLGCGHPFSLLPPPFLPPADLVTAAAAGWEGVMGREDLMFCRGCRDLIGEGDLGTDKRKGLEGCLE